ncbi:MAG: riboflavin synthase [Lentisphaeria bacterium]|nr:riboflavin synthase [Lentisphaeria bacterium]
MFTGLIQQTGSLAARSMNGNAGKLTIRLKTPLSSPELGESIAINGVCLTLEQVNGTELVFHVMEETFNKTNLGSLPPGSAVNVERALRVGDRLGGHFVSGHVDGTGRILSFERVGDDTELHVTLPAHIAGFLVPKGSIAIDGISLTIASLSEESFTVRIIPTTWNETNLSSRKCGDLLNLEADMLGKQIRYQLEAMFGSAGRKKELTMDDLIRAGF